MAAPAPKDPAMMPSSWGAVTFPIMSDADMKTTIKPQENPIHS
jgi:hypothetical protein